MPRLLITGPSTRTPKVVSQLRRAFPWSPVTSDVRTHVIDASKLAEESDRATEMLAGKVVARVARHRAGEVLVEFEDGTRLFVDRTDSGVELSITGGAS